MITVDGIGEKPGVVDRQIAMRDYLSLTISFDHTIIDGAPAAGFAQRLKELIESGYGLGDSTVESEQAGAERASQQKVDATRNALPREQNERAFLVLPIPPPDASHVH
jgi:hypothetical protein